MQVDEENKVTLKHWTSKKIMENEEEYKDILDFLQDADGVLIVKMRHAPLSDDACRYYNFQRNNMSVQDAVFALEVAKSQILEDL